MADFVSGNRILSNRHQPPPTNLQLNSGRLLPGSRAWLRVSGNLFVGIRVFFFLNSVFRDRARWPLTRSRFRPTENSMADAPKPSTPFGPEPISPPARRRRVQAPRAP